RAPPAPAGRRQSALGPRRRRQQGRRPGWLPCMGSPPACPSGPSRGSQSGPPAGGRPDAARAGHTGGCWRGSRASAPPAPRARAPPPHTSGRVLAPPAASGWPRPSQSVSFFHVEARTALPGSAAAKRRGVLLAALGPKLAPPEAAGQEEGRKTTGNLTLPASAGKPAKALRRPAWPPRPVCWALLTSPDGHRCCDDIHEAFLSLGCAIIC